MEPTPSTASARRLWLLWLGNMLGFPLLLYATGSLLGERMVIVGPWLAFVVIAGLLLHLHLSARLGRHLAAAQPHDGCLVAVLILSGWAVMGSLALMGCVGPTLNAHFQKDFRKMQEQQRLQDEREHDHG